MTLDWTLRAFMAGVVGTVGTIVAVYLAAYGAAVTFALLAVAGWAIFVALGRHPPSEN